MFPATFQTRLARGVHRILVPAEGQGAKRIDSLDILRGLMALSVAFYHFNMWHPAFRQGTLGADTLAKVGVFAVEGFFIISGFCFFHLYRPESFGEGGLARFHIKRFLRIAPLYYLVVILNMGLGQQIGPGFSPRMLLENATFTFGLDHPNCALVLGGWSIGLEYVFYMALPALVWAAARLPGFLYWGTLALLGLSMPYTLWRVPAAPYAHELNFHLYVLMSNHAFLFLLGGLAAQWRRQLPWRLRTGTFLLLAGALAAAFVLRYRPVYDHFHIMSGPPRYYFASLCFGAVAVFAFYDFPRSPLRRVLVFLGDVSYATYLLHPFAEEVVKRIFPLGRDPMVPFVLGLALTIGLGAAAHWALERPFMALGRRLTAPKA